MEHWSDYWLSTNALNSFGEGSQSIGYGGLTKKYWKNSLSKVSSPNYKALDIGTGNGGLAILLLNVAKELSQNICIDAIDPADIKPPTDNSSKNNTEIAKRITFYPKTYAENTGLPSNAYQLVVSQFGFEYSNKEKSLAEICRLLFEGGHFFALCHTKESSITQDSLNGLNVYTYLLKKSPLIPTVELLIDLGIKVIPQIGNDNWHKHPYRKILKKQINWIFSQAREKYNAACYHLWIEDVYTAIYQVIDNLKKEYLNKINELLRLNVKSLDSHYKRLEEQVDSSLDERETNKLTLLCKSYFTHVDINKIYLEEGVETISIHCKK